MKKLFSILVILVIAVFVLASCNLFGPSNDGLSLYVTGNPDDSRSIGSRNVDEPQGVTTTATDGAEIVVTKVEMVILELSLDVGANDSEVEDLEVGPFLFELPLDGSRAKLFDGIFVPGTYYEELEIEVDAPGDEYDAFFTENYSNWNWDRKVSIRVTGTYQEEEEDPVDFTYELHDFNDDFEIEFEPPLQISDSETSIVLAIDVSTWFTYTNDDGDEELFNLTDQDIDASQIEDNIENSFEAFEDSLEN